MYDVIVATHQLPWPTSSLRRWVARLGHDENCSAVVGSTSCAWFTWTDGSTPGSAWINWAPVGDQGAVGITRFLAGTDGSGDVGVFDRGDGPKRSQLIAYISRDRRQVRYGLLSAHGVLLSTTCCTPSRAAGRPTRPQSFGLHVSSAFSSFGPKKIAVVAQRTVGYAPAGWTRWVSLCRAQPSICSTAKATRSTQGASQGNPFRKRTLCQPRLGSQKMRA